MCLVMGKNTMERRNPLLVSLLLITIALVDFNVYAIHIPTPNLANALGMTLITVAWFINGPLIAGASVLVVAGHTNHLYNNKNLLTYGLLVFVFSSLLIAIMNNDVILILLRIIQGMSMGAILISAIVILRYLYSLEKQIVPLAMLVSTFAITQAIGPIFFGAITEFLDWQYVFFIDTLIGIVVWLLYIRLKVDIANDKLDISMKVTTATSLVVCLFSILALLNNLPLWSLMPTYGWLFFLVAVVSLLYYVANEYREPKSIFKLPLLLTRSSLLLLAIIFFTTPIYMGTTFGINIYLQHIEGYSPLTAGFIILAISASLALGLIPLYFLGDMVSERVKLMLGAMSICIGLIIVIFYNFVVNPAFIIAMILIGLGLSFSFLYSVERVFYIMYKEFWGVSTSVVMTIWAVAGSLGTALTIITIYYFGKLYSLQVIMKQQLLLAPAQQQALIHIFDGTRTLSVIAKQFSKQTSTDLIGIIHVAFIYGLSHLMWIFLACAVISFVLAYFVPKLEQPR